MHDTLALAHPELVFPTRRGRLAWLLKEHAAARMADRIVTVSETSARELKRGFACPPTGSASSPKRPTRCSGPGRRRPSRTGSSGSTGSPRGSIPALRRRPEPAQEPASADRGVFQDARRTCTWSWSATSRTFFTPTCPEIESAIAAAAVKDRVLLPGFIPDGELVSLYSRAEALVQPSLMEGFGLPAVEAMACGTPVLSSRAGSLPEVVGDAGSSSSRPRSTRSPGRSTPSSPTPRGRTELARRALLRAARFSWDRSAETLLACFSELVRPH